MDGLDKIAIKYAEGTLTYDQLFRLAADLLVILKENDNILIGALLPSNIEFSIVAAAILHYHQDRFSLMPLSPENTEYEREMLLEQTPCDILLCSDKSLAVEVAKKHEVLLIQLCKNKWKIVKLGNSKRRVRSSGPKLILHTSGTTATPKAIGLSSKNIRTSVNHIVDAYNLCDSDVCFAIQPMYHGHGLIGCLLSTLASGGSILIPTTRRTTSDWTWTSASPHFFRDTTRLASIVLAKPRFVRICSAPLTPEVLSLMRKVLHCPIIHAYGMSESAHAVSSTTLATFDPDIQDGFVSVGVPFETARIDKESGEIVLRGENLCCYPDEFRTGDLGFMDNKGQLYIIGRCKEQACMPGGQKVSLAEIDAVAMSVNGITDSCAYVITKNGEDQIGLAVEAGSDCDGKLMSTLESAIRMRLAIHKRPTKIHIVRDLGRSSTGKLNRRTVASKFIDG